MPVGSDAPKGSLRMRHFSLGALALGLICPVPVTLTSKGSGFYRVFQKGGPSLKSRLLLNCIHLFETPCILKFYWMKKEQELSPVILLETLNPDAVR